MKAGLATSVLTTSLVLLAPVAAFGQTAPLSVVPAAAEPADANDIVVTAQRRSQGVSKVPLSIQAIDGATLVQRAIVDTKSLVQVSPSVGYQGGFSVNAGGFLIRGVTSNSSEGGIQQSTAMLIDGVPLARPGEFVSDLGDIERVEILRGPQGTLIGKNATAGAISIVTQAPKADFAGEVQVGATTDQEYSVRAMLNIPLGQNVRTRFNAFFSDLDPLVRNLGPAGDIYGRRSYAFRSKLAADLSSDLHVLLSGEYTHQHDSFTQPVLFEPNTGFAALQVAVTGFQPRVGLVQVNTNGRAIEEATGYNGSAEVTWNVANRLVLTSLSAYRDFRSDNDEDNDLTPLGLGVGGLAPNPSGYPIQYVATGLPRNPTRVRYFTQELRLNYSNSVFDVVGGLFFQTLRDTGRNNVPFLIGNAALPAGSFVYSNAQTRYRITDDTYAAFADVVGHVTRSVSVFGGLRFTHETIGADYGVANFGPIGTSVAIATPGVNFDRQTGAYSGAPLETRAFDIHTHADNLSGRVGIQWQPSQTQNYYFSYNRGYKGPAIDVSRAARAPDPTTGYTPVVAPETAYSFELGTKQRLLDNRVQFSLNLFRQRIDNLQQNVLISGTNSTFLINAGALKTQGVEFDGRATLARGLNVDAAAAYTDATYVGRFSDGTLVLVGCYPTQTVAQGCVGGKFAIAGTQARGSYRWRYNVGGSYATTLPGMPFGVEARAGWSWYDRTPHLIGIDPLTEEPSHGLLEASLTFTGNDKRWSLQIYGKNLTDDFFFAYRSNSNNFLGRGYGWLTRDYQRYGGARLTYDF